MCKRLLMLTALVLAFGLVGANTVFGHVLDIPIADNGDDAEQHLNDNRIDSGSSDLEIPYEDGGAPPTDLQVIGVRYAVGIGQGRTITSAYLMLQADKADKEGTLEPVNVIIHGELSLDAAQFANVANNITDRPTTAASVMWSIEPYTEIGQRVQSPDLSAIIQEIIDQEGWAAGNGLVLIISDDPDNPSTGLRESEAGPGDDSATLHIEWGPATDEILREAEYPDVLGASWRIASDPAASGLKSMGSDNGDGNDNNTAPGAEWVAVYNFMAAGGDYKILFRGREAGSDSFWVRITTATGQTLEDPDQVGTGWVRFNGFDAPDGHTWDEVHSNDHDNTTVIWTLPAGENTLEIAKREDGTYLDGFLITNNLDLDQRALGSSIDPPPVAGAPMPDNGAIELAGTTALAWTSPAVAVSSTVYLSTDGTIDEADLAGETELSSLDVVLAPGVTYWWRVDAVEADGVVNTGEVWSFSMLSVEAHFPAPADGATLQAINAQLSWAAGLGSLVRDVYFSADLALVEARDASIKLGFFLSLPGLDPGLLENDTTYYWAVDEIDSGFSTNPGPIWSFTTIGGIAIGDPSLLAWYTFDKLEPGDDDSIVIDWSGHGNTGVAVGDLASIMTINDPTMGQALSLPGGSNQFIDCGAVGLSGNDPTTIACFAKADHTNIPDWTLIFGFTGTDTAEGGNGSHFNIGSIGGPGGIGAHVWGWEETILTDEESLEWHHYAMTYDGTTIAYYADGMLTDTEPEEVKSNIRDLSTRGDRVHIGSRVTQDSSFPGDVDDCRVYNRVLSEAEIAKLALRISDVTGPNDVVVGVPDEVRDGSVAGWPGGEHPALAIDDNVGTKYLHFKGEVEPTGFRVAPAMGPSVVTGLTFTTANDSPDRDPITYELSGSNESLDGPYELIASGEISDFNQAAALPRFTQNGTAIMFENSVGYAYYQVMFPTVRDAASANSMQIAEVELLGAPVAAPVIAFVSFHGGDDEPSGNAATAGFSEASDKAYTALLAAQGYDVRRFITTGDPDVGVLNAADLVIISRAVSSGNYSNDSATTWNGVTSPMIILGGYVLRTSRMGFTTGTTMVDTTGDVTLTVNDPAHPIFAGIDLVDGTMVNPYAGGAVVFATDGTTVSRGLSINNSAANADGTVLAVISDASAATGPAGGLVIGEWSAGATMEHNGGAGTDILAGDRLVFLTGSREPSGVTSHTAGLYDLFPDGEQMLLNAVDYMLP